MTVSVWQELAADRAAATHDLVVIGAGIVGSYAASLLVQTGRDVALVDAHFPAWGASGCNAGFVLLGMRYRYPEAIERLGRAAAREVWTLTAENVRRMRDLARQYAVEYEDCGATLLAVDEQEAGELRAAARLLQEDGFDVEYVERDPLGRGFLGALIQPRDFAVQPAALTQALARASGATRYDEDEVFEIRREGSALVVRARQTTIRCGGVLLATNVYTSILFPFLRPLMEPIRNQVLLTDPLPPLLDRMGYAEHGYHYFRQLRDGRMLVGGGRHRFPQQEATFADEVTPNIQELLARWLGRYFPETARVGVSRRWAGIDGLTPDGLPLVGCLPSEPAVVYAIGFGGHGNSMGLVAAERAVELLLRGIDPGVFSIHRLG